MSSCYDRTWHLASRAAADEYFINFDVHGRLFPSLSPTQKLEGADSQSGGWGERSMMLADCFSHQKAEGRQARRGRESNERATKYEREGERRGMREKMRDNTRGNKMKKKGEKPTLAFRV